MRGKGARLGEGCPKVRLSQDRMPIFPLGTSLACQGPPMVVPDRLGWLLSGLLRMFGIVTLGIVTFGIVTYDTITWCHF